MAKNKNAVELLLKKAKKELKIEEEKLRNSFNSNTEDLNKAAYKYHTLYELYFALEEFVHDDLGNPLNDRAELLLCLDKPLALSFWTFDCKPDAPIYTWIIEEIHKDIMESEESIADFNEITAGLT